MPVQNQSIYNSLPKINFIQASLFLKKKKKQHKYDLFNAKPSTTCISAPLLKDLAQDESSI